jgi:hypothetical protein
MLLRASPERLLLLGRINTHEPNFVSVLFYVQDSNGVTIGNTYYSAS